VRHTIVTMTRGDAHKIAEWLDYHARLGFDDLQVVLDGDVDGTEELLRSVDVPAEVTVHWRAEVGDYYDGLSPAERRHRVLQWREKYAAERASGGMRGVDALAWRQHQHFGPLLAPYAAGERGEGWLGLIDVDEFVVLTQDRTIGTLTAGQPVPRLRLLNFNVDTSGYDPARPVLEQHSVRWSREDLLAHDDARWAKRVKSLVDYRHAKLNATVHKINRGEHVVLDPDVARLHHFKMPASAELDLPFTVDDPIAPRRGGTS
jgi:hypothetical protein